MEDNNYGWKGFMAFMTCKPPLNEMNSCLSKYYGDKDFRQECENMYLERRSNYRRTGVMEKNPYDKKPYYDSERKREFLANYKAKKASEAQNTSSTSSQTD